MTLAPGRLLGPRLGLIDDAAVVVQEELGERCAYPGCRETPEPGAHHIEPRSRTGGPKKFVVIDGLVVSNRCRVCSKHHLMVTGGIGGHMSRVIWHDGHWCWLDRDLYGREPVWYCVGPLVIPHQPEVCNGFIAV